MRSWKYKNLQLFALSITFAFLLSLYEPFHIWLLGFGNWGYVGAFFAGILFVSTFTVATGIVILLVLAEQLSAIEIGIIAGLGAVIGDFVIFRFVKDGVAAELLHIYHFFNKSRHLEHLLHSRYFSWIFPVVGAVIIASPLPDEIGVSLMGISKMKTYKFLLLSFILNAIGIFLVVSAATYIRK
jgi:hypothetical protein